MNWWNNGGHPVTKEQRISLRGWPVLYQDNPDDDDWGPASRKVWVWEHGDTLHKIHHTNTFSGWCSRLRSGVGWDVMADDVLREPLAEVVQSLYLYYDGQAKENPQYKPSAREEAWFPDPQAHIDHMLGAFRDAYFEAATSAVTSSELAPEVVPFQIRNWVVPHGRKPDL